MKLNQGTAEIFGAKALFPFILKRMVPRGPLKAWVKVPKINIELDPFSI